MIHWLKMNLLDTPIEYLKGVGPKRAEILKRELNIHKFTQLLTHYPFRYVDRSKFYSIADIHSDSTYIQLKGTITNIQKIGKPRSERLVVLFQDNTGIIELVWFKGVKWLINKLQTGEDYVVFGKPTQFKNKFNTYLKAISPM